MNILLVEDEANVVLFIKRGLEGRRPYGKCCYRRQCGRRDDTTAHL